MWTRSAPDGLWSHSQQKPLPFLQITYMEFLHFLFPEATSARSRLLVSLTNYILERFALELLCCVVLFWYTVWIEISALDFPLRLNFFVCVCVLFQQSVFVMMFLLRALITQPTDKWHFLDISISQKGQDRHEHKGKYKLLLKHCSRNTEYITENPPASQSVLQRFLFSVQVELSTDVLLEYHIKGKLLWKSV